MTTPANELAQLNSDRRQLEAQALAALVGGHIAPAQQGGGLGATIGEAFVRIRPDTDGFEQETDSKVGAVARKVGGVATASMAAAGAASVAFGVKAVGAASDLEESLSKVQVVFGDSAGAIEEWGKSTEGRCCCLRLRARGCRHVRQPAGEPGPVG